MRKQYVSSYWNNKGKYQKLYEKLYDELVPLEGKAQTEAGEILRIVCNLYYDVNNNGGCNFDVKKSDRLQLMLLVPDYAKNATKRFIKQPKYGKWLEDKEYVKFLDLYVDWAILYVNYLKNGEALITAIPE